MKTLTCREHGGTFSVTPGRGRPPTRCGGKWDACSRAESFAIPPSEGSDPIVPAKPPSEQYKHAMNESVSLAMAAKERLQAQGWLCKGRAWITEPTDSLAFPNGSTMAGGRWGCAEVTATRGDETLFMVWAGGELKQQDYSLWHEKPSANNKPRGSLTFDPDECTDKELIRALAGCKITWWNTLGQFEMSGIIDPVKIRIEHIYNGKGDETPGDRIIHFNDRDTGGGFRAIKLAALLKVG